MIEVTGDLFGLSKIGDLLVFTANNMVGSNGLVMGAGIALSFKNRFPGLSARLGDRINGDDFHFLYDVPSRVGALQTKRHWKNPSDPDLIVLSCHKMLDFVDTCGFERILMTRPGCGNGGLNWETVKPTIAFLDDRFVVVNK